VEAVALWFDPALLGEAEARRRVLSAWSPGAGVYALAGGFLLRLPTPSRVASAGAPGLPFTLEEGVLLCAPLSPSERERLAPPPGAAVLVRAGTAEVFPLDASRRVEVSAWLDVSAWEVLSVEGLGAPPPPPAQALTPVAAPTRASFGLGSPAPEAEVMRARMEGRPVPVEAVRRPGLLDRFRSWWRGETPRPGARTVDAVAPVSLLNRLRSWLRGGGGAGQRSLPASASPSLLARLGAWLRGRQGTDSARGTTKSASPSFLARWLVAFLGAWGAARDSGTAPTRAPAASPAPPPPPRGPGLLSQLAEWLARSTPLGPLLGRRKAEYVRRLFDMFDEGNLDEALRHAIPLSKGGLSEQARLALGVPGPREQLTIQPRQGGVASVFGGGQAVFEALRERYRAAFRKLEREGRIEEAAFILAELLHESEEAVSFLERHGRLRLAAELAEGRKLAPGLVVRQWMLAKDVARAVDIARSTGAFADAVPRLERTHAAEARVLRLLWGEVLAQAGDYGRAVEVVWPMEDARRLTLAWLERGVEVGGVGGARLLARMAVTFPERFDAVRARVLALLDADDAEGVPARQSFTAALTQEVEDRKDAEAGRALLRPAVRAVLRDRAAGHLPAKSNKELERIVLATGDTVLRADLPTLPQRSARVGFPADGAPAWHTFDAAEGGPWELHDAVSLPGGRLLVALGEAGARLLTPDGRCVAHFDVPAFSLVLSVHGDRALALAPRGSLMRLSRLDLLQRRAEPWCDARVDAFAPMYDGSWWFIAVGDTVMAVDVLASDVRALWRVPQVGEQVLAVAAGPSELSFVTVQTGGELERWSYSLPDPTLRARQPLPGGKAVSQVLHLSLRPDGELAANVFIPRAHPPPETGVYMVTALLWLGPFSGRPTLSQPGESPGLVLGGAWMASVTSDRVQLLDRATGGTRAVFSFPSEPLAQVSVRFVNEELLLFDKVGRLARVDLSRGEVRRVVPR
jgi:hypothetical protein